MIKSLYKHLFVILVIFLVAVHSNVAQVKNTTVVNGWVFEDFEKNLNDTNKYVTHLFQDSKGFIWMGTYYGINVFDGENFTFYKNHLGNNNGFKGDRVKHISENSNGKILVAMRSSGINVFNPETGQFKNYYDTIFKGASSDYIQNISESKSGDLYITTNSEVILAKFDANHNLVQNKVLNVKLNAKEYLREGIFFEEQFLIETNQRILAINGANTQTLFEAYNIRQLKVRNNELWILANSNIGRCNMSSKTIEWLDYNLPKSEGYVTDFEFLFQNTIFIGTKYGCIQININKNYEVLEIKKLNFFDSNSVAKIFYDKENNLYFSITGEKGGVRKLNINQINFKYIGLPLTEEEQFLHVFLNDNEGIYWSGSSSGVFAFNPKTNNFLEFSNSSVIGLEGCKIKDIIEVNGEIWLNTNKGLAKYNKMQNNFEVFNDPRNINNSPISKLCINNDNLWFSTTKGIAKLNTHTKKFTYFETEIIAKINEDANKKSYAKVFGNKEPSAINIHNNILWVNIQTRGLFSYDISSGSPELLNIYREDFSMLYHSSLYSPVRGINIDKFDRLWLSGTNGIYVYDYKNREIITHLNKSNILEYDVLFNVLKEKNGNFWVKQFNAPAICIDAISFEILEETPNWMQLPRDTGATAKSHLIFGPTYQDKFKQIFINGTNGYIVYHPDKLEIDKIPPRVVLTNVDINGASKYSNFVGTQNLNIPELKYDENSILLNLKSISHDNSPLKKFAYRLKGVSKEWKFSNSLEPLNYIDLKPNTYSLEVKSTNDGKLWSPIVTLVAFDILPPWWKTNVAYISYLLILALLGYSFYKIQLNRRLAESESQKLREVDDFKNKFYQNITHEFRTPLTVIIGMAESLESKASKMIKRNANQLLKLVNELLEIGKIESNYTNLELSSKDIVKFTKYCMESLESLAKHKEISLRFQSDIDNLIMDFDVEKMQLVLNNLLSNAIKFTPVNGTIDVSVSSINNLVKISVKDTGIGISEENTEHIFERYFQEKKNQSVKGSGIGLALSRELIKLMNGSIVAKNNDDKGACFTITLPITNDAVYIQENTNLDTTPLIENTAKDDETIILVIEDNEDVLTYISSVLNPLYKVVSAPNGKAGYEKSVELIPDLIISDVMMPIMDGYEACKLIKSDFRTNHIPVIMLTAKADIESKISGLHIGADMYLTKPFNAKELLACVENLIEIRENLKKKYSQIVTAKEANSEKLTNEFLISIKNLILDNLSNGDFGINEICKEMGVSRTQLHRKLKALSGLSTSIFVREIKLEEGHKLLLNTEMTISEIAYSIGFSSPDYFSKLFTQKFNSSPLHYRQNK